MAEFGKRNTARAQQAGVASAPVSPNVAEAVAVVKAGKLPAWTRASPVKHVMGLLLFAAAYFFFFLPHSGNILRDIRLAGTWQPAYDLQALDGRCKTYQLVLTDCSATIKSIADPSLPPIKVTYMMSFTTGGGELLIPVRSTRDPSAVAILYSAEAELLNRTLMFMFWTGMSAFLMFAFVNALLRGRYRGGAEHRRLLAGLEVLQAKMEQRAAA